MQLNTVEEGIKKYSAKLAGGVGGQGEGESEREEGGEGEEKRKARMN